jgi:hypothetical protein
MSLVEELRKWIQSRPKLLERVRPEAGMSTEVGGGKIIETVTSSVQNLIATIQERRPKILPTVVETIKSYEPGRIVKTVVEETTKTVQEVTGKVAAPPAEVAEKTVLLRKVK